MSNYSVVRVDPGAAGVTRQEVIVPNRQMVIRVPPGMVGASVTLGARDRDPVPLDEGHNRVCLPEAVGRVYITAPPGDVIQIVSMEEGALEHIPFGSETAREVSARRLESIWMPRASANGAAFQVSDIWSPAGVTSGFNGWITPIGAGASTMEHYRGVFCGRFNAPHQRNYGPPIYFPESANSHADRYRNPEAFRVWRVRVHLAVTAGGFNDATGLSLLHSNGGVGGLMTGGGHGFGLVGDGAGWRWVEKDVGGASVYPVSIPLVWPVALTEWCEVEIRILAAVPGRGARAKLLLDGVTVLDREWGAPGVALPLLGGSAFNRYQLIVHNNDAVAAAGMYFAAGLSISAGALEP